MPTQAATGAPELSDDPNRERGVPVKLGPRQKLVGRRPTICDDVFNVEKAPAWLPRAVTPSNPFLSPQHAPSFRRRFFANEFSRGGLWRGCFREEHWTEKHPRARGNMHRVPRFIWHSRSTKISTPIPRFHPHRQAGHASAIVARSRQIPTVDKYIVSGTDTRAREDIENAVNIGSTKSASPNSKTGMVSSCFNAVIATLRIVASSFILSGPLKIRTRLYCSPGCQKSAWRKHQLACHDHEIEPRLLLSQILELLVAALEKGPIFVELTLQNRSSLSTTDAVTFALVPR
ncbi:hypothetical protein B0H16DRAFT_1693586 [Mycena metata]|uniref:Uncharacterized protein n=1 Tax=Mycena metata TaxID=1033252 RepID=A0AAD7N245_9AGAR|nr:hypothetical protein B0H16DRAFT_1693586 [Mycena metata]